jgi:hypothetical protein
VTVVVVAPAGAVITTGISQTPVEPCWTAARSGSSTIVQPAVLARPPPGWMKASRATELGSSTKPAGTLPVGSVTAIVSGALPPLIVAVAVVVVLSSAARL